MVTRITWLQLRSGMTCFLTGWEVSLHLATASTFVMVLGMVGVGLLVLELHLVRGWRCSHSVKGCRGRTKDQTLQYFKAARVKKDVVILSTKEANLQLRDGKRYTAHLNALLE
ncbi:hypothetical protein TNCV_4287341 [Trichonephila clavipes]|uniref:Uncharacterized protein n=1 Tax=Trichonephila clavipes TaxID=2585209 RepID=A0A8X6SAH0_TRICX|nr:hypothetical protein TNCV_4287341 [Trichonephila clavipes]